VVTTFVWISLASEKTEDFQTPQCMLCEIIFSNANLKPSKLQEQFNNEHGGAGEHAGIF